MNDARPDLRNIVITGFMGTGKSTVGPLVAKQLGRPFVETDREIEKRAGMDIPRIFAEQGEAAFRRMERELCAELAAQQGLVIATGGGMLVDPHNLELMLASGFVVCLWAAPETLAQRLDAAAGRPLAAGWRELLAQRREAYATIPHQVETTGKTPAQIAEEMIGLWRVSV